VNWYFVQMVGYSTLLMHTALTRHDTTIPIGAVYIVSAAVRSASMFGSRSELQWTRQSHVAWVENSGQRPSLAEHRLHSYYSLRLRAVCLFVIDSLHIKYLCGLSPLKDHIPETSLNNILNAFPLLLQTNVIITETLKISILEDKLTNNGRR
jgi:hypothetical protein